MGSSSCQPPSVGGRITLVKREQRPCERRKLRVPCDEQSRGHASSSCLLYRGDERNLQVVFAAFLSAVDRSPFSRQLTKALFDGRTDSCRVLCRRPHAEHAPARIP